MADISRDYLGVAPQLRHIVYSDQMSPRPPQLKSDGISSKENVMNDSLRQGLAEKSPKGAVKNPSPKSSPGRGRTKSTADSIASRSVADAALSSEFLGKAKGVQSPNALFLKYINTPLKWAVSVLWTPFHNLLSSTAPTRLLVTYLATTWLYMYALLELVLLGSGYDDCCMRLFPGDLWARVHIFSLSLIFKLWSVPHYRSQHQQQDLKDNLRNVAIPGTGIPLSVFCYEKYSALCFIMFVVPLVCLIAAFNKANKDQEAMNPKQKDGKSYCDRVGAYYIQHLIHPDDWFSFWQLNCRLASWHSCVQGSEQYSMEDKWTFLREGHKVGVPVSPFLDDVEALVVKHKSIEGGMGIHFYKNATKGGDWILQKKIHNDVWLNKLLPKVAPLSTMRIITFSTWGIHHPAGPPTAEHAESADTYVEALSAVLRLGRAGAATDHSSVMFDVDARTGRIKKGVSNAHWYQLGAAAAFTCPWLPREQGLDSHPDSGVVITGTVVPGMDKALEVVVTSHFKLLAEVPIVGWDVCFTPDGIVLLEVNLSCNFFRGSFAVAPYLTKVEQYFKTIERLERANTSPTATTITSPALTARQGGGESEQKR